MSNTDLLLKQREHAQEDIAMGAALDRLRKNPDFQKVVEKGYLEAEAIRLVHAKALASMQEDKHQWAITKAIDSVGIFREYLRIVKYNHDSGLLALEDVDVALAEDGIE